MIGPVVDLCLPSVLLVGLSVPLSRFELPIEYHPRDISYVLNGYTLRRELARREATSEEGLPEAFELLPRPQALRRIDVDTASPASQIPRNESLLALLIART